MKNMELKQADNNQSWVYAQEVRQERKASKHRRQQRSQRKTIWQAVE
jgi:hypothetical protein